MSAKASRPIPRAALGIAALALIAILANWLVALLPIGSKGIDFTKDNVHTMSPGTKSILGELQLPVTIRYYATRTAEGVPREITLYMRRVEEQLKEYQRLSDGKVRLEILDPQPDTDAEDAANIDRISGQRLNEHDNFYFGVAISCLDRTTSIPMLDPNGETMLEYQLSRAIAEVSRPKRPVIGVMSNLPIATQSQSMPGQPPSPPWVIAQQIKEMFEVRDLGMNPAKVDPTIDLLLVFHPVEITREAEYAIDQYLLRGGTVIACVDPYSITVQMTGGDPTMGAPQTTSTLPTLLSSWGIGYDPNKVVADARYRTKLGDGRVGMALLNLPRESMPQKDNVITRNLNDLYFILPAGFTRIGTPQVTIESLVQSSPEAALAPSLPASRLDPAIQTGLKPVGTPFDLALHLHGMFPTSFPLGRPTPDGQQPPKDAPKEHLDKATKEGHVFLIGDIDAFYNNFAYQIGGTGANRTARPTNGNSSLLLNILDQATSSTHLIGARSRSSTRRPFTVIHNMEAAFDREAGQKINELQQKQDAALQRLNELQTQKARGAELKLSPEQEAEIRKLEREQVDYRKQLRDMQKDLRTKKDKLSTNITLLNVLAVPLLIALVGGIVTVIRRRQTAAR